MAQQPNERTQVRANPVRYAFVALRVALGVTLILGGLKLAFPPDPVALAAQYVDQETGWIAGYWVAQIETRLGIGVPTFLRIQGVLEIGLGLALAAVPSSLPVLPWLAAALFVSFVAASPVAGVIRLSRDVALALLCVAVAIHERVPLATALQPVRWGLAFTLAVSALFADGVMANVLNQTLPPPLVLGAAALLAAGLMLRPVAAAVAAWLGAIIVWRVASAGLWIGLEGTKREIALAVGALVLAWLTERSEAEGEDVGHERTAGSALVRLSTAARAHPR